jgi:hypothetical protein
MTQSELLDHMERTFRKNIETARAKNCDYAGGGDAFGNFRLVESFRITSVERGIMVRLSDKFARIVNLLDNKDPQVTDERFSDSIDDAINYLAILKAWRECSTVVPSFSLNSAEILTISATTSATG